MIGKQDKEDGMVVISTKIKAHQAELLNTICNVLGVNTYQIFQMFFYVLAKASAPMHEVSPEIRKVMTMMETDADWMRAFNLAAPEPLKIAQVVLILQQEKRKGFGAVMIDKNMLPGQEPVMTENVDMILERVFEVTSYGIRRRLMELGGMLGCKHLSDVLTTMIDSQMVLELDEMDKAEMKGEAMFDDRGRRIEYGKKTKSLHHRTPDGEARRQQRLLFDDFDRETGKDIESEFRPHGEEW